MNSPVMIVRKSADARKTSALYAPVRRLSRNVPSRPSLASSASGSRNGTVSASTSAVQTPKAISHGRRSFCASPFTQRGCSRSAQSVASVSISARPYHQRVYVVFVSSTNRPHSAGTTLQTASAHSSPLSQPWRRCTVSSTSAPVSPNIGR